MKLLRFCLVAGWCLASAIGVGARAAISSGDGHVQASLVAADASIQPGRPFVVALRLVHAPHWHTYWINPGTGLPTSLKWTLPPGFEAGPIEWPAPAVLRDHTGTIVGNGYDGDTLLPVRITPPAALAPGSRVVLAAQADWLMCSDECVPGSAKLSLTLPVATATPTPEPVWGPRIAATLAALPRELPAWKVIAARKDKSVTLMIQPAAGSPSHVPADLHFFSRDGLIAYDQAQTAKPVPGGAFVLELPVSDEAPAGGEARLDGVLTADNGWNADGSMPGLKVDVPFSPPAALAAAEASRHGADLSATTATPPGSGTGGAAARGIGGTLVLAFLGGLILNLMPCVFPVLGIKILGFVNQAGHERGRVIAHGLVFALGVLLSFWALAGALAILRAGGQQLGWGFQLQSAAFVFSLAALMLIFALNLSGVFEFGLRATAVGGELQTKSGFAGSFFTGVLATVVATPCSAPFLAPALGAALALSTAAGFAIFTAIALGLSTPYLLLSVFPSAIRILPRPGAWMETFKQFMAFPLYATVGYLIWVLAGQVTDEGLQNVLFGLVLVALGVWFYGRWNAPGASRGRAGFGMIALVVAGGAGLWLGWPHGGAIRGAGGASTDGVTWQPWSPEAVAKLRAENRIVYVDFTARWCATCQANKKLVFHSADVLRELAAKKVVTLRADWTNQDPRITAELARYHRSAVPFNLIWFPGRAEPVILPELLTPSIVLRALNEG